MTRDLILLGLLNEGPKHGYEIKKTIKEVVGAFTNINLTSIYYPLRILEKSGLVIKRIDKSGNRPQKHVYTITDKGRQKFLELLNKNFMTVDRPPIDLDISLYFLPYVEPALATKRLKNRVIELRKIKRWLAANIKLLEHRKNLHMLLINKHSLELIKAEINFTNNLIRSLKRRISL